MFSETQFQTLLAAIFEWKAQNESAMREISDLRKRIAVVESKVAVKANCTLIRS